MEFSMLQVILNVMIRQIYNDNEKSLLPAKTKICARKNLTILCPEYIFDIFVRQNQNKYETQINSGITDYNCTG